MPDRDAVATASLREVLDAYGADTAGYYRELRALGGRRGVFHDPEMAAVVVTGHALCSRLFKEPGLSKARLRLDTADVRGRIGDLAGRAQRLVERQMSFDESADAQRSHARWRRLLAVDAASPQAQALRALASTAIDELEEGAADVYNTVLRPYVSRAVADRLALGEVERQALQPLVYGYADFLDGKASTGSATAAALSLALLSDHIGARFERLSACDPEPIDDRARWIADYALTLVAGHESTAFALGVALMMIAEHGPPPAGPAGLRRHLVEALRFDSPIQLVGRVAARDLPLAPGLTLRAGERLFLHVGAANRDPERFAEPERFDPCRSGAGLLSFGLGPSRCVGLKLALLEAEIFFDALLRRPGGAGFAVTAARFAHGLAGRSFDRLALAF